MYRQIMVTPEHRHYQHILWRESPYDPIQEFELNTVTHGLNCAPYLALRVLQFIADHDCVKYPLVKQALQHHTYVDDICFGADTVEEAVQIQKDLMTVLRQSGLELKKWSSNTLVILEALVGTKRGMLSLIARIFDPLRLLSPVIFLAKYLMQRVWRANVTWDEKLSPDILEPWCKLVSELPVLQQLSIPRFTYTQHRSSGVLCGFCGASERGYAAILYLRVNNSSGPPLISLLGAKTKLAPMKFETIPRLELCAALLLASWMARIKSTLMLELAIVDMYAWSDSMIVLNWLSVRHETFKIFVSNRIFKIHSLIPQCRWSYIASANNPADCASRGLTPPELKNCELYWHGPAMLLRPTSEWETMFPPMSLDQLPEVKPVIPTALTVQAEIEWFSRFSSFSHMIRVVARLRRVITRHRLQQAPSNFLTRLEFDQATFAVAHSAQTLAFGLLLRELNAEQSVSARHIARLRPFLDNLGLIRVGGRLSSSDLSEDQKHPILLPKSSHLSLLIVRHWHLLTGHSGPRVMTNLIGRTFWILSLRTLIRHVISRCSRCVRLSGVNPQPLMADLPR